MRTPEQRFAECERAVAELLRSGDRNFVTVRYVMHKSALSQGQVRRLLNELTAMGWLRKKRVPNSGDGYFPTDLGRVGFGISLPTVRDV